MSSDGRGPYIQGADGVRTSIVLNFAALTIDGQKPGITNPRTITVNLNHPVPGGGGVPLGVISDGNDNGLHTQWRRAGMVTKSLDSIPVGQTVTAAQMNVTFHVNGHFHVLQIGSQPFGHCHVGTNLVHGRGTSSGTIYRASWTKWVIDLPVGSVGRLFDLSHTTLHAVDKGLYYVHLHYEIGN